jgi:hypothetical protein
MKSILLQIPLFSLFLTSYVQVTSSKRRTPTFNISQLNSRYQGEFVVVKIDSIHSYYLIYARKGGNLIKIISKKNLEKED